MKVKVEVIILSGSTLTCCTQFYSAMVDCNHMLVCSCSLLHSIIYLLVHQHKDTIQIPANKEEKIEKKRSNARRRKTARASKHGRKQFSFQNDQTLQGVTTLKRLITLSNIPIIFTFYTQYVHCWKNMPTRIYAIMCPA